MGFIVDEASDILPPCCIVSYSQRRFPSVHEEGRFRSATSNTNYDDNKKNLYRVIQYFIIYRIIIIIYQIIINKIPNSKPWFEFCAIFAVCILNINHCKCYVIARRTMTA